MRVGFETSSQSLEFFSVGQNIWIMRNKMAFMDTTQWNKPPLSFSQTWRRGLHQCRQPIIAAVREREGKYIFCLSSKFCLKETSELTNLLKTIPGFENCDKEDANEWLESNSDPGFQILSEDEIIKCVQEISDASDNETDEDGDDGGSNKGLTHAEGFAALETAMLWYGHQSECCPTKLLLLKGLRDLGGKKLRSTFRQREISNFFNQ